MIRFNFPVFALAAVALVAACSKQDPVANGANDTAGLPAPAEPAPDASGEPPSNAVEAAQPAETAAASKIPAALQGRWGLSPADCDPGRSDAKGLLVVSASDLRFYESRAVPTGDVESDVDSINGSFSFTGEGQSWTKYQSLQVRGRELVRSETKPAASFTYAKCT